MEQNQNDMNGNEAREPVLKVGEILRTEREARGLSVEEIAERVKFSVRQVEALEHDDAEHLPQGTFLRGFIRSYARVLGMDDARLLAATHTQTEHHFDVMDVQGGGAPLPVTGDASRRSRYLMLSALAVAILLAGFVWTHRDDVSLPAPARGGEVRSKLLRQPVPSRLPMQCLRMRRSRKRLKAPLRWKCKNRNPSCSPKKSPSQHLL